MSTTKKLNFYEKKIADITGIEDPRDLSIIEDFMRNSIFHSTLDWQTADEFQKGALKALSCIRLGAKEGYWESLNSDLEVQE